MFSFLLDTFFPCRCVGCGKESSSWICQECTWHGEGWPREAYPGIWALASFKEPLIREAIHGLKYHSLHELAGELVGMLWCSASSTIELDNPLLIPVPTSFKRKKKRGYNQAELIAQAIQKKTGWEITTNLLQKTASGSQVGKTKTERQSAGYRLRPKQTVPDRQLLLVDDLCTTGSTLTACRKALGRDIPAIVLAMD